MLKIGWSLVDWTDIGKRAVKMECIPCKTVCKTCDSSVVVIITPSTCHVFSHVMYVTGPFNDTSIDYLLVADYNQQHVYQLQPSTGELRSLFTDKIRTLAMALDASRRLVYLAYVEDIQYRIRIRSFDSRVNSVIYYAPSGVFVSLHYMSCIFNFVLLFILTIIVTFRSIESKCYYLCVLRLQFRSSVRIVVPTHTSPVPTLLLIHVSRNLKSSRKRCPAQNHNAVNKITCLQKEMCHWQTVTNRKSSPRFVMPISFYC